MGGGGGVAAAAAAARTTSTTTTWRAAMMATKAATNVENTGKLGLMAFIPDCPISGCLRVPPDCLPAAEISIFYLHSHRRYRKSRLLAAHLPFFHLLGWITSLL